MNTVFKVSQIGNYIANLIKRESILSNITIEGEISNYSFSGGNIYFNLKDESATIRAVIFRSDVNDYMRNSKDGDKVLAKGNITTYTKGGYYQIVVKSIEASGSGMLYNRYLELKNRLFDEGIFDPLKKEQIKTYPVDIGIVSSINGAALRDVVKVIRRRYRVANIWIYPSSVQGVSAPKELITGLGYFETQMQVDFIIIARGGGSFEDLNVFNDESLIRYIYAMKKPVVSAVGHQVDFTLTDLVADLRAATPTEAGEISTPLLREMSSELMGLRERLFYAIQKRFKAENTQLEYSIRELKMNNPAKKLSDSIKKLEGLRSYFELLLKKNFLKSEEYLDVLHLRLKANNPINVLNRGYCAAFSDAGQIQSIDDIDLGEGISVMLMDGMLNCTVESKETKIGY